jgi:hypothetical protein
LPKPAIRSNLTRRGTFYFGRRRNRTPLPPPELIAPSSMNSTPAASRAAMTLVRRSRRKIQPIDKRIDEAHWVVRTDIIVNRFRQQQYLGSVVAEMYVMPGFYRVIRGIGNRSIRLSTQSAWDLCTLNFPSFAVHASESHTDVPAGLRDAEAFDHPSSPPS